MVSEARQSTSQIIIRIHSNNTYTAEFIHQSLMMHANLIDMGFKNSVKKLHSLGCSCIYLKLSSYLCVEYLYSHPIVGRLGALLALVVTIV